ncbi:MAG: alpha/beta hydrolase [Proteobacteria bacterium]|nr:MAG: alpha/beta hydrolase [Pseudomonadota bacterium]
MGKAANRQMQDVLDHYAKMNPLPVEDLSPVMARQQTEIRDAVIATVNDHTARRAFVGVIEPVHHVEHISIAGPGGQLLLRIYSPAGDEPMPATLYYHGGGMVIASLNSYDASCRALCNAAQAVVISVAYRQAPEHPYPAAAQDAFAAYHWVLQNAREINVDPTRVAVTGESAGGNLAAGVCLRARELGMPQPVHQVLVYPMLDARFDSPSYLENANAKPLNKAMMEWFWGHYLPNGAAAEEELACPLRAKTLSHLAPATMILAELDPLRSDGQVYAERLRAAGIDVEVQTFEGVSHEFFGMGAVVQEGKQAVYFAAERLSEAFEEPEDTDMNPAVVRFDNNLENALLS